MGSVSLSYKGHRYPVEVISHCVWLYFRLPLSFREVEELMLERGIVVSHETVRRWCARFGQAYANALRRRQPRPGDKWHLDEVFVKINGEQKYLWRAVDQDGNVLHSRNPTPPRPGTPSDNPTPDNVTTPPEDWAKGTRFGEVKGYDGDPLRAPTLPETPLKPRGRVR